MKFESVIEKNYKEKCEIVNKYCKEENLSDKVIDRVKYIIMSAYTYAYTDNFKNIFYKNMKVYESRLIHKGDMELANKIKELRKLILEY